VIHTSYPSTQEAEAGGVNLGYIPISCLKKTPIVKIITIIIVHKKLFTECQMSYFIYWLNKLAKQCIKQTLSHPTIYEEIF
jgi:hypothetical protein